MHYTRIALVVISLFVALSFCYVPKTGLKEDVKQRAQALVNKKLMGVKLEPGLPSIDPNKFIDFVLQMVDQVILDSNLDPYEFAEGEFLGVNYDAWIGGYSSLARLGDASVIKADNTLDITVMATMTNLAGNFSFWFDILGVTISGGATATIVNVDMKLALRFVYDPTTNIISPFVDDFQITEIGFIDVQVFGLGPFDFLADLVAEFVVNLIKYLIPILADNIIETIIQEVLDAIFSYIP